MFSFLKYLFSRPATVESITAAFHKQAAKLEALVEHRDSLAEAHRIAADELKAQAALAMQKADEHEAEADRALAVAARLRDLTA
jgi:hypothetical protein